VIETLPRIQIQIRRTILESKSSHDENSSGLGRHVSMYVARQQNLNSSVLLWKKRGRKRYETLIRISFQHYF